MKKNKTTTREQARNIKIKEAEGKRIEEEVFSEEEKAELLELAEFLEGLALDLQTIRFMAY